MTYLAFKPLREPQGFLKCLAVTQTHPSAPGRFIPDSAPDPTLMNDIFLHFKVRILETGFEEKIIPDPTGSESTTSVLHESLELGEGKKNCTCARQQYCGDTIR